MQQFSALISKLRDRLVNVIRDRAWAGASSSLDGIAEVAVEALVRGADDDIADLDATVHELYTEIVVDHEIDARPGPAQVAAELRGYSRLLGAAARNRRSLAPEEIAGVTDKASVRILQALHAANHGQSGIDLARLMKLRPETVARKLPLLRIAGLIRSWPAGRLVLNALTPLGRLAIGAERPPQSASDTRVPHWVLALQKISADDTLSREVTATFEELDRDGYLPRADRRALHSSDNSIMLTIYQQRRLSAFNRPIIYRKVTSRYDLVRTLRNL